MTKVTTSTDEQSLPKLRPKTIKFIELLEKDSKLSHTQAYLDTHQTTNRHAANVEASKLLAKPSVIIYRKKHEELAKRVVVEIALKADKPADRLKAAQDILDRNLGKAIQHVESNSTTVNLNVEASQELNDQFTRFLTQSTKKDA